MNVLMMCLLSVSSLLPTEVYNKDALAAILIIETNCGRNNKPSSKGARGIAQIMPETGGYLWDKCKMPGVFVEAFLDNDIMNLELANCFIKILHERYGDWLLTAAHYNGGTRAVKAIKKGKNLNTETARYVVKFLYLLKGKGND